MMSKLIHFAIAALLFASVFLSSVSAIAATYCDGMGVLAELAAKMRDKGLSESQALREIRKLSPSRSVTQDVNDLVSAAYTNVGRTMSPAGFRSFFESYCRNNGFDRPL